MPTSWLSLYTKLYTAYFNWERLELRLGHNSLVGTTVKHADHLPADVLADEKHTRLNGDKVYVATTVGAECVLGASITAQADAEHLPALLPARGECGHLPIARP